MRCYPVSTRINHVANDDKECSAPVELAQVSESALLLVGLLRAGYKPRIRSSMISPNLLGVISLSISRGVHSLFIDATVLVSHKGHSRQRTVATSTREERVGIFRQ